jgi:cytochrome c553
VSGTLSSTSTSAYAYPAPQDPARSLEPQQAKYLDLDVNYGTNFSFNAGTGVTTPAAATTLVTSPIATACFSCHDSIASRAHIEANGGSLYQPRSTALAKIETCMVCHETGRSGDIRAVHKR